MKNCFSFSFSLQNEDYIVDKNIIGIIPFKDNKDINDIDNRIVSKCNEYRLEHDFGIHDICGGEVIRVDNTDYKCIFGFMTYEVSESKIEELMKIWFRILTDELNIGTEEMIIKDFKEVKFI